MKLSLRFFALFVLLVRAGLPETTTLRLAETGTTISLTFQPVPAGGDNFRSIRINSGGRSFEFRPKHQVARIPNGVQQRTERGLWAKVDGLQLDNSGYFFRGEYTTHSRHHTLLFFISEGYASNAAPLFVLGFKSDGSPYKVLERSEMDPYVFEASRAGGARIAGKATMSQVMFGDGTTGSKSPYALTYDPFAVFVVREDQPAEYSFIESRKYNLRHYVWAGMHSREDYAVLYNLPGHPKPLGARPARALALVDSRVQLPTP